LYCPFLPWKVPTRSTLAEADAATIASSANAATVITADRLNPLKTTFPHLRLLVSLAARLRARRPSVDVGDVPALTFRLSDPADQPLGVFTALPAAVSPYQAAPNCLIPMNMNEALAPSSNL
jgi:hypothetical protein